MKTILAFLTALFVVPALLLAQAATAPAAGTAPAVAPAAATAPAVPAAPAANLGAEIELLKGQINQFQTNVSTVKANVQPVVQSLQKLEAIGESYPKAVSDFKAKYDIPANASTSQEVQGVSRAFLEKAGLSPEQAKTLTKSVEASADRARAFKPLAPESIMISVGIAAGMNVLGQLKSSGKVDLTQTVQMLADKSFWGGLAGSTIGYCAASYALAAFLPPGAGFIAAFLPTFGALTASIIGGELGAKGVKVGFKEALSQISIAEILAQAAGSTVGMFAGATLVTSLAASLGAAAGPIGMVLGGLVGGQLGLWAVRSIKALFGGNVESQAEGQAASDGSLPSITQPASELPAGPILTAEQLQTLRTSYQTEYQAYVSAQKAGDAKASKTAYANMASLKSSYEAAVRKMVAGLKDGHQPAPTTR